MGTTPRTNQLALPMPARSTEVRAACFGQIYLSYVRSEEALPTSYFQLGLILHEAIEYAVLNDADQAYMAAEWWQPHMFQVPEGDVIESSSRDFASIFDDYQRFIAQWFRTVHPDGDKRHPVYDEYQWPPVVEKRYQRGPASTGTKYGVWSEIDAIFKNRIGSRPNLIVDWKSSKKRLDDYFQLDFYRYTAHMTKARAGYHMLDRVQNRSIFNEAPKYVGDDRVRERILDLERQKDRVIEQGLLPTFKPDWYCAYCQMQRVCPVAGGTTDVENLTELKRLVPLTIKQTEIQEGN